MTLQSLQPNRQIIVAFITLIVVAVLFAYYFLVHTKNQESRLIHQAFNNLNTLSKGFHDNLESHRTAIENLLKGNSELLFATYDSLLNEYEVEYQRKSDSLRREMNFISKIMDYRRLYYAHISSRREIENNVLERLRDIIPETDAYKLVNIQRISQTDAKDTTINVNVRVGNGKIIFTSTINRKKDNKNEYFKLQFNSDLASFISSTFNDRIFSQFMLISDDSMVYQTMDYKFKAFKYDTLKKLNREINYLNNIVRNFVQDGSTSNVVTDESLISKALSAPNLYDINISETRYKLFLNQFEVNGVFWVLGGFMDADLYNQQIRAVEPAILLIAITVLLFILLASQIIKLVISSEFEQFFIRNIIISVISLTIGSSILVIGLMSTISYWAEDRNLKDRELEILNDNIRQSFSTELSEIIDYIQLSDDTISHRNWLSPPARMARQVFSDSYNIKGKYNERYDNTYWISRAGNEIIQVYESIKPVSYLNLKGREYFQVIRDGDGYIYDNAPENQPIRFYFQPLKSWVTGKKTVVVSIPSSGKNLNNEKVPIVAAMATQFRSLQNCLLPFGYGFALIDASGAVLFHDDDRLSLSENFIQECSEVNEIKSAILSRSDSRNSVTYHNRKYRIYLSPIDNMPLYLVTYHNREYFRLPGVLIFYYTILFSLIGLISVGFWVIFLYVFNYHGSKLKFKGLILNWAVPNSKKLSWYWKTAIVNLITLTITCIAVIFFGKTLTNKFLLLFLACNFVFPVNYIMLKKGPDLSNGKLSIQGFFLNGLKDRVIIAFLIILVMFNIFLWYVNYGLRLNLLIYQIALILILFIPFYLYRVKSIKSLYKKLLEVDLAHAYTAFTISWLTLVSIIPSIFYFNIANENEMNIWKKFDQLQLIRKLNTRNVDHTDIGKVDRGIYIVLNMEETLHKTGDESKRKESKLINTIFYHLRPPIVELADLTKSFIPDDQGAKQGWDLSILENGNSNSLRINYKYLGDSSEVNILKPQNLSQINKYSDPQTWKFLKKLIITVFIVILLVVNYFLLYYLLNKIFGFKFLISNGLVSSTREQIVSSARWRNDVFVVGLPAPDLDELKQTIINLKEYDKDSQSDKSDTDDQKSKIKVLYIDLQERDNINIDELTLTGKNMVVIDHFEYSCNDLSKLRQNLSFVEKIKHEGKQIIIFSNISPRQVERIYKRLAQSVNKRIQEGNMDYLNDEDLWAKLLSTFHVLHYKLAEYKLTKQYIQQDEQDPLKIQLAGLIEDELSVSTYFRNIEHLVYQKYLTLIEQSKGRKIDQDYIEKLKEEMILYIQDIAQSYYFALWGTCYKKQRFLLYDLAYDGIANFKDGATVLFLLKKGILKFDNGIHIMNNSFRHFVIDAIGEEDALAMRREMERGGTWSSTKIVLIIVAISLVIFIILVNKGSINQLTAIITGIVALVGALFRLLSFSSGSSALDSQ